MNFHSDAWVMDNIRAHYDEALEHFPEDRIVGIFCQGSTNYGLDTENSDIDTKLIVVPTFADIAMNRKAVSTTHVRANDEHIDFKDIRLMLQTFRKQNLNFLEILFTDYKILNPTYADQWNRLIEAREAIAHYNRYAAVKAMRGVAMEKFHAMEHRYPAKEWIIEKYGYDGKQVHHLVRVEDYLGRYIAGVPYEQCLKPTEDIVPFLFDLKAQKYPLEEGREIAKHSLANIDAMYEPIAADPSWNQCDASIDALLDDVQVKIMQQAMILELGQEYDITRR